MKGKAILLALAVVMLAVGCQSWNGPTIQMPGKSTQPPADMPPAGQPGLAISSEQRFPDVPSCPVW